MPIPFKPFQLEPDGDPLARIVGTLLKYAIKDGAREIHLCPDARGVAVFYLMRANDELRQQMKIPLFAFKPLRAHLEVMMGPQNSFRLDLHSDLPTLSLAFELKLSARDSPHGQDLILALGDDPA